MLCESFHERDAERPDIARGRDDSLRDFGWIVGARMAQAGGEEGLLRFGRGQMRLLGVLIDREDAVAGELKLILDGENVRGPHVSMDQTFGMEEAEGLQSGSKNVARFRGSERALRKKLREIFLGVFHYDVEQFKIAEAAAAGLERAEQVGMRKFVGVLPAKQLEVGVGSIDLDELDGGFLWRSAAFGQEDSAVFRAAEITAKEESGLEHLAFPLFPGIG